MPTGPTTHPSAQELSAFSVGKMTGPEADAVGQHIETCDACRDRVAKAAPDSLVGLVRAAKPRAATQLLGDDLFPPPTPASAAASFAPPEDVPPQLANHPKYRIVRELGRGGMGVVYQAVQTIMDRAIAIKVINPSVLQHPDALPRFHAEVKAAARLDHQNIVRAHDADQVGGLHLLVMEFIEGSSLAQMVQRRGPLPIVHACHYVRQAALGLQHAFEQGMVHRDIKPQNLMLTRKGVVKILDFGLARLRGAGPASGGLTAIGTFMGTPEYVSPEQAMDARSADTRADLYSLGCTLYFLLTGRPPFVEDTVVKLVMAQIEKEPRPVPELRPDAPPELSAVVARLLAKDPVQRYQKPVELAQALMPFIKAGAKGGTAAALPPGVASPARGTVMPGDTSRVKGPGNDASQLPVREAVAAKPEKPFANLGDACISAPKKETKRHAEKPGAAPAWKRPSILAGTAVAVLALVMVGLSASGVFKVKTKDGTIILENLPADAEVTVDGDKVTLKTDGNTFALGIAPGKKHRLQVKKDGFTTFGEEVEIDAGGRHFITVRLEPLPIAAVNLAGARVPVEESPAAVPIVKKADYAAIATGKWIPVLEREMDLRDRGVFIPEQRAGDVIIRARVKKVTGQNLSISLRCDEERAPPKRGYSAWFNGGNWFGIMKWSEGPKGLEEWHAPINFDDYFEFAFSAVGEMLTIYADGKRIGEVRDPDYRLGALMIRAFRGQSLFQDVEIMILDKSVPATDDKGFVPLFNRKDLTGWHASGASVTWRVIDGTLTGSGPNGVLITDRSDFENFRLRVEGMLGKGGDSGVFFRVRDGFSYEAQIGGGSFPWAKNTGSLILFTKGRMREPALAPKAVPTGQWFTMEILAEGNQFTIWVNGNKTVAYEDKENPCSRGAIQLQAIAPSAPVRFRKVEIKELPSRLAAAQSARQLPKDEPAIPKALGFIGARPGQDRDDNSLKMKFCWCPPGQFTMGSPANEPGRRDDEDQVEVKFPHGFWMAKYPVTQGEWKQLMRTDPSCFCAVGRGKDQVQGMDTSRFPVEQVNPDDATSFAQRFTEQERSARRLPVGWEYRLPTEAQWEYACRAGTKTATAFGDQLDIAQANFGGRLGRTCRVGSYLANAWGLYDMHGNVFQWCRDWYGKKLPGGEDPEVTVEASARVLRGIGWNDAGSHCRSAARRPYGPWVRDPSCGFRLAAVQSSR